jgi:hypothetical protein
MGPWLPVLWRGIIRSRIRLRAAAFLVAPFAEQDRLQRKGRSGGNDLGGRVKRDKLAIVRETIGANQDIVLHTVHNRSKILRRVGAVTLLRAQILPAPAVEANEGCDHMSNGHHQRMSVAVVTGPCNQNFLRRISEMAIPNSPSHSPVRGTALILRRCSGGSIERSQKLVIPQP